MTNDSEAGGPETIMPIEWREAENWPYIGERRLRSFTADVACAEDGTRFVRVRSADADGWKIEK